MTGIKILTSKLRNELLWMGIKLKLIYLFCAVLRSPDKIFKSWSLMKTIRKNMWGGNMKKLHRVGNKYISNMYSPPWPSVAYNDYVKRELKRYNEPLADNPQLSFVFFRNHPKMPSEMRALF